ncbi:MAG: Flp pilus assembly protein CpaB [Myxococcota bacterium]
MQNRRAVLFLVLAVVLGLGAAFMARNWLESQTQQSPTYARTATPVVAMRNDVPAGSVLAAADLITVDWPLGFVPQGTFDSLDRLEGRVLRRALASGEPVLESALLPKGSPGGLVSMIDPSLRAISVKVDPVVGVAGFVVPGSRVDVITTLRRLDRDNPMPYSKVILQNVKVLAIDQKVEAFGSRDPEPAQVVTLEVNTEQAELLTYAVHEGKLQLALRHPKSDEVVNTPSVTVGDVLGDVAIVLPPKPVVVQKPRPRPRPKTNVEVVKGAEVSVESF